MLFFLMFHNNCPVGFIWLQCAVLNTNVFLTFFCIRLQNVLEDFRDMDATALEETKATVRPSSPSLTHRYICLIISSTGCLFPLSCFEPDISKPLVLF